MPTVADFQLRFPEFCGITDDRVQLFLDDALLIMGDDTGRWLDYYDVSALYLAAHFLTVANNTEDGDYNVMGPVTRQEVDDVIIEQATLRHIQVYDDELYFTSYGKRFIRYRRICFAGIYGV